jgi:hypothetical protein
VLSALVVLFFSGAAYFILNNASAATSGQMTLYLHKERSDINQSYNLASLTPPEPAADTSSTSSATPNLVNGSPPSLVCASADNTSDTFNQIGASAAAVGNKCIATFISSPVGQAIAMSTADASAISGQFWFSESSSQVTAAPTVYVFRMQAGQTQSLVSTDLLATFTCADPGTSATSCVPTAVAPSNTVTFAAGDRIAVYISINVTAARSGAGVFTYVDSSARFAAQVDLKYTAITQNKPTLTGPLDDDFTTAASTTTCTTSGVTYNNKWICLQGSRASTTGAFNAEDTAASSAGDNSSWLWLRNQVTATTVTPSNFGTTPSNTFLYQTMPLSYGDGSISTVVNSTSMYTVGTTTRADISHTGLVLWTSNTDYLELQVYASASINGGATNTVDVALNNSGTLSGVTSLNPTTTSGLFNEVWLRFANTNGSWQAQYSTNGSTWSNVGSAVNHSIFSRTGLNSYTGMVSPVSSYAGAFEWFKSTLTSPSYSQISYRWFANADSTTPGSPFAAVNAPYALTSTGQQFRLRALIGTVAGQTATAGQGFDLQYAALGANPSCSAISSFNYKSVDQLGNWSDIADSVAWTWRNGMAVLNFNNKMWVLGGYDNINNVDKNDVWSSSDGITWTQATSAAGWAGREDMGYAVFNNKMWIMGGSTIGGTNFHDVWSSSDGITWTQATSAAGWAIRAQMATYSYNSKLWIAGGSDQSGTYYHDVWSSSDGITWTQATSAAGWAARIGMGYTVFNNKMWIMGGNTTFPAAYYHDVWSSSDGITWTQATSAAGWTPRYAINTIVMNNEMVILNGTDPNVNTGLAEVWQSTDGISWNRVGEAYSNLSGYYNSTTGSYVGAVAFNGNAWILSGGNSQAVWKTSIPPITYYNNPTPADEANISTTGTDPTNSGNAIAAQTYREVGGFNNKQSALSTTTDGEWDFSLYDNGAPAGTAYCFRVVTSDDADLYSYANYPMITTYAPGPTMDQVMRGGTWFNSGGVKQDKYWAH